MNLNNELDDEDGGNYMVNVVTLPNGIRLVMERIPFVRSISMGIWVKNGSRNENLMTNGISHFIEHMLFKGTANRSAKDIADEMDAIGGQLNAYTSKEYTAYYTRVLDNHFDIALDILADMFFNSNFHDSEIEKERNVIFEEISMYRDTPEDLVHDILQMGVWENDPLGYPILGTTESISAFNCETLAKYFEENYCPENTVISIAGNFSEDVVHKKIEKYFSYSNKFERKNQYKFSEFNSAYNPCTVTYEKDIEQLHICVSFPGIEVASEDVYRLSVLNTLFGGGMSSRLFQNIREDKGLVYSIYSFNASYINSGLMTIYAALNPEQVEETFGLIIDEIRRIRNEKIDSRLLNNTKEQIKSNYLLSLEGTSTRMTNIGKAELLVGKIPTPDEVADRIDSVTADDVYEAANKIFDLKMISLSAVGKTDGLNLSEMVSNVRK